MTPLLRAREAGLARVVGGIHSEDGIIQAETNAWGKFQVHGVERTTRQDVHLQKLVASHLCPMTALADGYFPACQLCFHWSVQRGLLTECSNRKNSQHNSEVVREVVPDMIAVVSRPENVERRARSDTRVSRLSSRRLSSPPTGLSILFSLLVP